MTYLLFFFINFRSDSFFGSSLFDDLVDGHHRGAAGVGQNGTGNDGRTSHTTFSTGNGNTIHITRTVIGGDGSVRREMRFRTPNAEPQPRPTARVPPTYRPPPTSETPPSSESRGQPDGAASTQEQPTSTTSAKPPSGPSTPSSTASSRNPRTPSYASPTLSSSRRSAGVGAPDSSTPGVPTPTASPSRSSNVRNPQTQRNGYHRSSRAHQSGTSRTRRPDFGTGRPNSSTTQQLVQCPLCSRSFDKNVIEVHASSCEGRPEDVPEVVTITDDEPIQTNPKVECPICNQSYDQKDIEQHAASCGEEVYV